MSVRDKKTHFQSSIHLSDSRYHIIHFLMYFTSLWRRTSVLSNFISSRNSSNRSHGVSKGKLVFGAVTGENDLATLFSSHFHFPFNQTSFKFFKTRVYCKNYIIFISMSARKVRGIKLMIN
ncbi:hypothetical protein BpHYR1_016341 [Brachionus plicatilis]|uniref:Uncharacterized protein n=1 Tax=Brachionus plicatilis TaxID=10195 RepID=A0A3M7QXU1_BRAPC|nr:hypothetical protein BpHYR1_016341 [Brachionus plicatilis]